MKKPLTFFLVIAAIIFVMSVFFEVSKIEVTGNSKYTADEIISASGIHTGDNLFFIDRIGAGSRIVVKLPYIESVRISRSLPNRVEIAVEESKAVACVDVKGELWSISQTGKFLGKISDKAAPVAEISGISVSTAAVGEIVTVGENEQDKLDYVLEILYQIQARGMVDAVSSIDISDVSDPTFEYDGRFLVKLGAKDNTEYKFGKLVSAVSKLKSDDSGTLDLSDSNKVTYNPN